MKEVKEVVHVPTRELAEEVLRVAKENGLMVDKDISIWDYYTINTYFRINKKGSFGIISNLLNEVDKIITAEEFLSRYKDSELEQLRKENEELKKQLKAIEDQPKVGDVCLFWDGLNKFYSLEILSEIIKGKECIYRTHNNDEYANCIKATDENIKSKIKELENE